MTGSGANEFALPDALPESRRVLVDGAAAYFPQKEPRT